MNAFTAQKNAIRCRFTHVYFHFMKHPLSLSLSPALSLSLFHTQTHTHKNIHANKHAHPLVTSLLSRFHQGVLGMSSTESDNWEESPIKNVVRWLGEFKSERKTQKGNLTSDMSHALNLLMRVENCTCFSSYILCQLSVIVLSFFSKVKIA